jgi:hypothetical protein
MLDSKNRGCIEIVEVGYDNFGVDISCWDLLLLTKSHACHGFFYFFYGIIDVDLYFLLLQKDAITNFNNLILN